MKNKPQFKSPIYFIGIGGSGMTPLALTAAYFGYEVWGSDHQSSANIDCLLENKIKIFQQHASNNLDGANTVIVSSAIPEHHIELEHAKKSELPIYHRSDFLLELSKKKELIAVSGTHGKTTTSSILTYLMHHLKLDPTSVIGGTMSFLNSSCRLGKGSHFVIEADESDGTFLKYSPLISILTNIDLDHLDYYGSEKNLYSAFLTYTNKIQAGGVAIMGVNNHKDWHIFKELKQNKISFGTYPTCDMFVENIQSTGSILKFDLHWKSQKYSFELNSLGVHNVLNATGALACLASLRIPLNKAIPLLKKFPGTSRRLSILFDQPNLKIIDDYAHNPGKILASIDAVKKAWPNYDLTVIFEPHRYSRVSSLYRHFIKAFTKADRVFVCPIYSAGEDIIPSITVKKISQDIEKSSLTPTQTFRDISQIFNIRILPSIRVILVLGAGDSNKISSRLKRFALDLRPPIPKTVLANRTKTQEKISLE